MEEMDNMNAENPFTTSMIGKLKEKADNVTLMHNNYTSKSTHTHTHTHIYILYIYLYILYIYIYIYKYIYIYWLCILVGPDNIMWDSKKSFIGCIDHI